LKRKENRIYWRKKLEFNCELGRFVRVRFFHLKEIFYLLVMSTGDIFVLGALRGLAHAGINGDKRAIIAASVLKPTQLRIADVISRPPDRWDESEVGMRFAYVVENQIAVERMVHLSQIRRENEWKENS
jgi:septum site-determining protein MinC